MSMRCLRTGRRAAVIIAMIIAVELAGAGIAMGTAPGLTTVVTASVDGATGTWAPAPSRAEAPSASLLTDPATPPSGPASDQSVVPLTPATPEAT